jgi:serine phosphatase RsbU (regulator of sigma subunit)
MEILEGGDVIGSDTPVPRIPLSLVPGDVATEVADLVFAGRYVPAGVGPEPVAGDFYDLLALNDDLVAVVVGDVAGHGSAAMVRMQQLRAATRAYALQEPAPASVIARLDVFCSRLDPESIATVWYAVYRPSTGALVYASAGHPPPVLTTHDTSPQMLEATVTPPLGVGVAAGWVTEHTLVLTPGAVLIAYSDGLIERRGTDFDDQMAVLTGIVRTACDPARSAGASEIAAEILAALIPDPAAAEDDVCLLVIRRQAPEA